MHVKRVYADNEGVLLYQNKGGVVYKTLNIHGYDYPPETILHVYERKDSNVVNFYDDWMNSYTIAYPHHLGHYTWQGRTIFQEIFPSSRTYVAPMATTRSSEIDSDISTPRYMDSHFPIFT